MRYCNYCQQEKVWDWNGERLKDGSKIYLDNKGHRWAGRRCPDCEKRRVQSAIRCDPFEKESILRQLHGGGYQVLSTAVPFLVEKDGCQYRVGVRYAFTENGRIIMEKRDGDKADLYALVFQSVRLCTPAQFSRMEPQLQYLEDLRPGVVCDAVEHAAFTG